MANTGTNYYDNIQVTSPEDLYAAANDYAKSLYGERKTLPTYAPTADMFTDDNDAKISSYEQMLAKAYAPKKEDEQTIKNRKTNAYISAAGDALTALINAGAGSQGVKPLMIDPSQTLSAQAKARYDRAVASQVADRDNYYKLMMSALGKKGSSSRLANYNKSYELSTKDAENQQKSYDNAVKSYLDANKTAFDQNYKLASGMQDQDNFNRSYKQKDEQFYSPQTATKKHTYVDNLGGEHDLTDTTTTKRG